MQHRIPRGLTARIAGFHPAGPGSTPGVGKLFSFIFLVTFVLLEKIRQNGVCSTHVPKKFMEYSNVFHDLNEDRFTV